MDTPKITITVTQADKLISDQVSSALSTGNAFKYQYAKQLVSRIRTFKNDIKDLPDELQVSAVKNLLIVELNIAKFAADQYAALNCEEVFNSLSELVEELEGIIKE